jgi:hypothetical protein
MAESITLADFIKTVGDLGVIGLLVVIIVTGLRRQWVWGWMYAELIEDRDEWKQMALHGTRLTERAVDTANVMSTTRAAGGEKGS